jgi:uncharacterized protein YcsI (UPF0317 family)
LIALRLGQRERTDMAQDLRFSDPRQVRLACRRDELDIFPSRTINGYLCVNLVMMDQDHAGDFHEFCRRNAVSCPLLAVLPAGQRQCPPRWAADCDLCTDLRSYDIIEHGRVVRSARQVQELFTPRTVSFLIGSSVSFDGELEQRGWTPGWGPCIYDTDQACIPVGPYAGTMAVTMRSFPAAVADRVAEFTGHFPGCHGGPIARRRAGDAPVLGIADESRWLLPPPEAKPIPAEQDQLYWACGITPSRVAQAARLPLMIVHTPGNALVIDVNTIDMYLP